MRERRIGGRWRCDAVGLQQSVIAACELHPDVILMDLVMPRGDGLLAIAELKRCLPAVKIIVLTTFNDDERVKAAFEAGANGYLLKDADGEALATAACASRPRAAPSSRARCPSTPASPPIL